MQASSTRQADPPSITHTCHADEKCVAQASARLKLLKLALLAAITVLALFLRLYQIDSLPPSDGYDQATYGLDVLEILQGARPIFLPSNFGREALFSYLVTLCYLAIRDAALAVYVTSAIVGALAIPATYLAAEEMFHEEKKVLSRYGSLLAALAIAVFYWHLSWSRLGMRAILVPLLAALTAFCFWRGVRTGSRWAFAACGLSLGLSMHSYQAARALPLLILLGFVYVYLSRRSFSWRDLVDVLLVYGAAVLVFAPLGYYFATHPGSSGLRIGQTLVVGSSQGLGESVRVLLERTAKVLLTLSVRGDTDARVNIPGRPALNPFLLAAFLLGTATSVLRIARPRYAFLLTWLVGLIAPAVLAELGPVSKRAIGATPAVAMLVAVGCLVPWERFCRWATRCALSWGRALSTGLAILIGFGFLYSAVRTYRDYFVVWSQDPNLFTHFETGQSAIGTYIRGLPVGEPVYLSPVPADHHSVVLNSGGREGVKSYQGRFCMVLPGRADHDTTYVIVPGDDKSSLDLLQEYYPEGHIANEGPLHYGMPYFLAYRVPAGAQSHVAPTYFLDANWDAKIQLFGYDLDKPTYKPGDTIGLTLYFEALEEMDDDYTVFTHLTGPENPASGTVLWAQNDSEPCKRGYPTSAWDPGEIIVDHFALSIPADAPPGEYALPIGFYLWRTMERLPVLDAAGQVTGDHVVLTGVDIE